MKRQVLRYPMAERIAVSHAAIVNLRIGNLTTLWLDGRGGYHSKELSSKGLVNCQPKVEQDLRRAYVVGGLQPQYVVV